MPQTLRLILALSPDRKCWPAPVLALGLVLASGCQRDAEAAKATDRAPASLAEAPKPVAHEPEWQQLTEQVVALHEQGKATEALELAKQAASAAERSGATTVEPQLNVGRLYFELGQWRDAEEAISQGVALAEKHRELDPMGLSDALYAQGGILQKMGKYSEARLSTEGALAIREQTLGKEHPAVAVCLTQLATTHLELGDTEAAAKLARSALAVFARAENVLPDDHAEAHGILSMVLQAQGKLREAEPAARRALALQEQINDANHPEVARRLKNLAGILKNRGDARGSESLFERVLAIWEQQLGPEHPMVAMAAHNLAGAYADRGEVVEAEVLYQTRGGHLPQDVRTRSPRYTAERTVSCRME